MVEQQNGRMEIMKKVYIAGPITKDKDYLRKFNEVEATLKAKGFEPVNPAMSEPIEGYSYRDYIVRGIKMLMECDAICMLPFWTYSKGARLEETFAETVGMEIYYAAEYVIHKSKGIEWVIKKVRDENGRSC